MFASSLAARPSCTELQKSDCVDEVERVFAWTVDVLMGSGAGVVWAVNVSG